MPSNKELTDQALSLGQKLGIEVVTQSLNNQGLQALVEELTSKLPVDQVGGGASSEGATGTAPTVETPVPPVAALAPVDGADEATIGGPPRSGALPAQRYRHVVAEGKMVTTRRGPLGAFQPISAQDLAEGVVGEKQLLGLVASGHVSKS